MFRNNTKHAKRMGRQKVVIIYHEYHDSIINIRPQRSFIRLFDGV